MLKLKKELRDRPRLVPLNTQVPQVDKDIVLAIGDGKLAEGLRIILFTFREDLKSFADKKIKEKARKGEKKSA